MVRRDPRPEEHRRSTASFDTSLEGRRSTSSRPILTLDRHRRRRSAGRLTLDTIGSRLARRRRRRRRPVESGALARTVADRPSDITGHVTFDLALELGRRFPRGVLRVRRPARDVHELRGDDVHARGQLTASEVLIADASARRVRRGTSTTRDGDDRHRRAVSVPLQGHDDGDRSAARAGDRAGAARREPADVRLRRHRPVRAAVHRRPRRRSRRRSFSARRSATAPSDRSTRRRRRCASPATARVDRIEPAPLRRGTRRRLAAGPAIRRHGVPATSTSDGVGTDRATLALTGGGRLVARGAVSTARSSDADVSIAIDHGTLRASYDGRLRRRSIRRFPFSRPAIPGRR